MTAESFKTLFSNDARRSPTSFPFLLTCPFLKRTRWLSRAAVQFSAWFFPRCRGDVVTAILGISAFCHDRAAALGVDGDSVAAGQEERRRRRKHDAGLATAYGWS